MRAIKRMQTTGVVGLCLLGLPLLCLAWFRHPALSVSPSARLIPAPIPHTPSEVALREALRYRTRAKLAVNREREMLEAWDPQAEDGVDPERWRLALLARDPRGDLAHAREAVRRAQALARTPGEAYRAAVMLVQVEHEAGHHAAELQHACTLCVPRPSDPDSLLLLRRAARCNGLGSLERQADMALKVMFRL